MRLLEGIETLLAALQLLGRRIDLSLEELSHLTGLMLPHPGVLFDVLRCERIRHRRRAGRIEADVSELHSDGCRTSAALIGPRELDVNVTAQFVDNGVLRHLLAPL